MQYGSYFELLIYLGNMMATIIAIAYAKNVPRPYCTLYNSRYTVKPLIVPADTILF